MASRETPWNPSHPATKSQSQLLRLALVREPDRRRVRREASQPDVVDLEQDLAAGIQPGGDQVLHDLLLPVDPDRAAGQVGQRDAVAGALEPQLDALVDQALAVEAIRQPGLAEQLDRRVLEDARP